MYVSVGVSALFVDPVCCLLWGNITGLFSAW